MTVDINKWRDKLGLRRGIERHNFAIIAILKDYIRDIPYYGRVIDLGCGNAPYKEMILDKAQEYIGVDWKNSIHDHRRVDVFADFSQKLPFKDDHADTLISFSVLEHLPEPDFFLSECFRILRPSGTIFMTVPFFWHLHEEPHDYFRYTGYGLRHLLGKNGFSDVTIREVAGFWTTCSLMFNYHTVPYARGPLKYLWYPIWWTTQVAAMLLDKIDPSSAHVALYVAQATKAASVAAGRHS